MLIYLAAFTLVLSGGFSWFFTKMHADFHFPVEFSVFYRQFFAAIFLFLIAFITKKKIKLTKQQFQLCFIISLLYYCIYFLAAYYGSTFLVSGIVAVISATKVFFVETLLSIIEKRKISGRILIAILLGLLGVSLLSIDNMRIMNKSLEYIAIGVMIAFFAPLANATSNVILHKSTTKKQIDNFVIIAYCSLIGAIMVLIVGLIRYHKFYIFPMDQKYIIGLAYLSLISSGLAIVCSYFLIDKIGSLKTTFMSMAHSPLAMVLAVAFQGYHLKLPTIIGMALCLYGLYIGLRYQVHRKRYIALSTRKKLFMRGIREQKNLLRKTIREQKHKIKKEVYKEFK